MKSQKRNLVMDPEEVSSKSFYNQLWELLETELGDTVLCDQMADRIYDLIKEQYEEIESIRHSQIENDIDSANGVA